MPKLALMAADMGVAAQLPPEARVITRAIDLTPVGQAATSWITWETTTPPGTTVTVSASLDGGATWSQAENGGLIPVIPLDTDLTGRQLLIAATLVTADTLVSPVLHRVDVRVNHQEWAPIGQFWSTEWQAADDTVEATVTARDRLELLRVSTYQSAVVAVSTTLFALAEAVLADAGLTSSEYYVDPALQAIAVPYAWFNPISHREALRVIAEAGLAQVYCDRSGLIRVEGAGTGYAAEPAISLTADEYFRVSNPMRPNQVANEIIVDTQPLRPVVSLEEIYRANDPIVVQPGQTVTATVFYNSPPVIDAVAGLESAGVDTVIAGTQYYGWGADIQIRNNGAVQDSPVLVITGRPLSIQNKERAVARDADAIVDQGLLRFKFPENPLVQTLAVAQQIADALLASAKDPRRDLVVDWRGNPAVVLGDRVTVKGGDYHVFRQEIDWAGTLSSTTTGRKVTG